MTFNSVSHLVFDYQQQIEEMDDFSHFDFVDEMNECYSVSDDDWHDYYDKEEYDDNSWEDLGGVNAES